MNAADRSDIHATWAPRIWPTPPWETPGNAAPSMPTSGWNGSGSARCSLRDGQLDTSADTEDLGLAVRVVHDGAWGFASGVDRTPETAATLAAQAVAAARVSRVLSADPVVLADEPVYPGATWISAYDIDPFDVEEDERIGRLAELSERLLSADGVDHVDAHLMHVRENKFYADTAGTSTTQQRVRVQVQFTAVHVDRSAGTFYSMRTLAPPVGRGWEFLTGAGWDFDREIAELPGLLARTRQSAERGGRALRPGDRSVQPVAHDP